MTNNRAEVASFVFAFFNLTLHSPSPGPAMVSTQRDVQSFSDLTVRFCIYGLLGWCFEIIWSAVTEKAWGKQTDWRLVEHTYLWMFPIYGLPAPLGEPVHNALRRYFWLVRGLVYVLGIWAVEYVTGWLLRKLTGKCPLDYSHFRWNSQGIITLEYAPVWFVFGLAFERVHDALQKRRPALQQAL